MSIMLCILTPCAPTCASFLLSILIFDTARHHFYINNKLFSVSVSVLILSLSSEKVRRSYFLGDSVNAAAAERIASEHSPHREQKSSEKAVLLKRFYRVFRTARNKSARGSRLLRGNVFSVQPQKHDAKLLHIREPSRLGLSGLFAARLFSAVTAFAVLLRF